MKSMGYWEKGVLSSQFGHFARLAGRGVDGVLITVYVVDLTRVFGH